MKLIMKRVLSFLIVLSMVVGLIPGMSMTAQAADVSGTLSDSDISLSYEEPTKGGTVSWQATDTTISGLLKSGYDEENDNYPTDTSILKITNSKGSEAILSFDYNVVSSTVNLNGEKLSGSGSKEIIIAKDGSVEIELFVRKASSQKSAEVKITNLYLIANVETTTEFAIAENGTYTVNASTDLVGKTNTQMANIAYELSATANEGYEFLGWYSVEEDKYVAYESSVTYKSDINRTIVPKFVPLSTPIFQVGTAKFADLGVAAEYADANSLDKIILISDGKISGNYTIPAGVTLLIPFNESNTCYTTEPLTTGTYTNNGKKYANPWEKPFPYRTLEMENGSTIDVYGAISVSAKHAAGPSATNKDSAAGSPSGPCGFIKMENNSNIIVKDGGALYAWGYVVGEGTVTTKSGGVIYENMQLTDFRGGSATLAIGGSYGETYPFFPFSQYYVQNIEVKSILESGAEEYLFTSLFAQSMVLSAPVLFIGGADAMFELKDGATLSKEYVAEKDRLEVHVEGESAINSLSVSLPIGDDMSIDSANFILPINSNIDIYIDSGTVKSTQNLVFLPGSSLHIAENAKINVANKLTFFDADDYKKGYIGSFEQNDDGDYELNVTDKLVDGYFVFPSSRLSPIKYTYENAYTRTEEDLTDVTFDVNGIVNVRKSIYTTMSGANIISSKGTGLILFPYGAYEEDLDEYTFQYNQGSGVELICIPITSALLKNADGSYTETYGAEEDDIFGWSKANDKWQKISDVKVSLDSNGVTSDVKEITISKEDIIAGEKVEITTLEDLGYSKEGYKFLGWSTDKNATKAEYVDGEAILFAEDTTLYAVWDAETFDITYDLDGGFISDDFDTTQSYEVGAGVTQPGTPTKEGYSFDGWDPEVPETMPAKDVTIKATYTVNRYEITFDNNGADIPVYSTYVVPYGASLTDGDYKLPEPGKIGYTFAGWKLEDGSEAPVTMPAHKFTLIATWAKNAYDFTYEVDGETTTKTVEFGDKLPLPADPEKEGHTFARWTDGGKVYTKDSTMPAGSLYVTAEWTKNSYPVTFKDSLSDTVYATANVEFDSVITEPAEPTKAGYTFAGWDVEIPAKMPAKELTFKAQWTINQYTITFDTDGGSKVAPITQDFDSAVTAPAAPTKTGYTFAGWDVAVPATMPAENVTLKAQWTINQYTITFDTDGGSAVDPITQDYNSAVTAPANPTKTGYTFDGWTPAVPEIMPAENTTVKAQWKVKQYTITFNTDGGSKVDPITAEFGAAVAVPANPTKPGYVFAGWDVEVPEIMPAENLTINANWVVKTGIVIEFDTKGGTAVEPITGSYGDKITAPKAPTKEGYTFKGWSPELPATMPADKLVVEAQWEVNQYTITFDTDGGNTIDAITADFGTPVTAPKAPTKAGHTFVGWDVEIPSTMPAGDMTIKAIWNVKNYKLTFNSNGGSEVEAIEAAYNTKVDAPAAPTKEKYTFVCWLDEKGKEVTFPVTMPEEGMILTAKWRYSYTGWDTDDNGKTYYNDGAIAYKDTLATIDGDTYFFDENGYVVTGLVKLTDPEVKGGCLYYYFQEDGKALKNDSLWIDVTDGILPRYEYEFNEKGEIVHDEDTTKMGIVKEDGVKYYYVYGVKAYKGVFLNEEDGEYYYVSSSGKLVVNRNYWISRVDGIDFSEKITSVKVGDVEFVEKSYTFDEEGRIVLPKEEKKNGIVAEEGSLFYYVNGVRTYAGLIQDEEGNYYYVRTSGELARNRNYYTTKHNGLLKAATYNFDENGKMTNPPSNEVKNGIVEENGGLYYYKDGKLTYAGLIEIDGAYYYVRTSGQLVTGRNYWITKHNDLKPEGSYEFAEDGKMIISEEEEVKDGIVEENGGLYYYKDGKLYYAGLIQDEEGNYYYVRTSGELVVGRKYWITKTNDLLPEKSYTFNELGQIVSN